MNKNLDAVNAMIALQNLFNILVNANWKEAGYRWDRAIWMECAELMDGHCHWKWWKAAPVSDPAQARLELVDIWHFILSWSIVDGFNPLVLLESGRESQAVRLQRLRENAPSLNPPLRTKGGLWAESYSDNPERCEIVQYIAHAAMTYDLGLTLIAFWAACDEFGLTFDELHRGYIAKNSLNTHRNRNGYKKGTYTKVWDGKEDNEHLAAIMDSGIVDFDGVLAALASSYKPANGRP